MSKNHAVKSLADIGEIKNELETTTTTTSNKDGLSLLLEQDRVVTLAGLRSLAGSIQFTLINTADWSLREQDKMDRLEALGLREDPRGTGLINPDLDQRNEQDEAKRYEDDVREHGHPMGFETRETPEQKLALYAGLYDDILHEMQLLNPSVFELPRPIPDAVDQAIANQYAPKVSETTIAALKKAGIDDEEFANAAEDAKSKRQANMQARREQIIQAVEDARDTGDTYAFTNLPMHIQLRLMCGVYRGIHSRRKQLVTWIATSGKTDDLGDVALLKNGLTTIEKWCRDFEDTHAVLFEAMMDAGVNVKTIDDTLAEIRK